MNENDKKTIKPAYLETESEAITRMYCSKIEDALNLVCKAVEFDKQPTEDELIQMAYIARYAFKKGAKAALYAIENEQDRLFAAIDQTHAIIDRLIKNRGGNDAPPLKPV